MFLCYESLEIMWKMIACEKKLQLAQNLHKVSKLIVFNLKS
jgi:hypothetical protein